LSMASKKSGRTAGPDKGRLAARRRAERNQQVLGDAEDPWPADFEMSLPDAPDEVLAKITPLPPKWTTDVGSLPVSPARTWLNGGEDLGEAGDLIAQWPFRMSAPGEPPGPWVCLAQLAYEGGMDLTAAAEAQCELEDHGLLAWDTKRNLCVMTGAHAGVAMPGSA
jgi:hypothetical protein